MSISDVEALTTSERKSLLQNKDSIESAVVTFGDRAQTVAVGLLSLGKTNEAKEWFCALVEEWIITANNRFEAKYQKEPCQSAQLGPWKEYISALYCAILGYQDIKEPAETVLAKSTNSIIEELENRDIAHRVDLARALSGYLVGDDSMEKYLVRLEQQVRDRNKPWEVDRYLPYVLVINGLNNNSESEVTSGIEGLLKFHRERVASAPDTDAVEKAVALDATAMLALARRHEGMAITIDHEAIPDALNDDEHYPVGE